MFKLENLNLQKNLECIERYNPKLKEDLLNLKTLTSNIELVEAETGEPNLIYNGIPLHSIQDPEAEAKRIFDSTPNSPTAMHVIFGFGLGHLFKEFCENSKGKIIVYEPNLEILRVTLELADFSKEFLQQNVLITSDIDTFKNFFMNNYTYNASATFIALDSYKKIYEKDIHEIFSQIEVITGVCLAEFNTLKKSIALSAGTMLKNISYTLNEMPLIEVQESYKGKTALIISAGPSLDLCIDTIKKNRNKVIIFCVGTAVKSLAKNGITPDFLNIIEVNDCSGQIKDVDLSDVNMILEPYTHNTFHQAKTKQKFLFPTNSSHANISWAKLTDVDITPYNAKGTVSYGALACAKMLGFSKIILVGQDLAYVNNQCYSKDSAYSELAYEMNPETNKIEVKIKDKEKYVNSLLPTTSGANKNAYQNYANYKIQNLNDTLYFVKGITGEMLPTQGGYATFIEHFREFALNNQDLDLINSSMIGAQIDGFKNIPLDEALLNTASINETVELRLKPLSYNREKIRKNLSEEYNLFTRLFKDFEKAQEYIFKYEREFRRSRTTNDETIRYFKLLMNLYSEICLKYTAQSSLYEAISYTEDIEIQYLLNNTEIVDVQSILLVYERLKRYFNITGQKLVETIKQLERQKEIVVEGINSAS